MEPGKLVFSTFHDLNAQDTILAPLNFKSIQP
jgi:hypothetical protein